jgi:hypothetical protein
MADPVADPKWLEQWGRVNRALQRVLSLGKSSPPPIDVEGDLDQVHAFFVFCFHLKDWLKADPTVDKALKRDVEAFVKQSPTLSLCADIANASKHLAPSRTPWGTVRPGEMQAEVTNNWARMRGSEELKRLPDQAVYYIEVGEQRWPVATVAGRAVQEWQRFLKTSGLL